MCICKCDPYDEREVVCTCSKKKFDPTKPVQTRDGRKAKIICTSRNHPTYPIVALVCTAGYGDEVMMFTKDGIAAIAQNYDLFNVKPEVWVNVYINNSGSLKCGDTYPTEEEAQRQHQLFVGYSYSHSVKISK